MTEITRRNFIKSTVSSAGQLVLFSTVPGYAADPSVEIQEKRARGKAETFLGVISQYPLDRLQSIYIMYDVHLKVAWNIRMKVSATIWMQQKAGGFISSFNLTEPEGVNGWSWLMLALFGKHTQEYKDMIRGIEVKLFERFHPEGGRFRTDVLEEILPEKRDYANQTAIKVQFEYRDNVIQFWEDKFQESFTKTLPYTGQIGPLTAFFNYLFSDPPETEMDMINVLKQVEDDDSAQTSAGKKLVRYLFESLTTRFGLNTTGKHRAYRMMVTLGRGNFLDIVFGDYLYYQLAHDIEHNLKIPYAAHAEGIISKSKKRKKIKQLKKKYPHRKSFEKELLNEVDDILAAKNIKVYLTGFDVSLKS